MCLKEKRVGRSEGNLQSCVSGQRHFHDQQAEAEEGKEPPVSVQESPPRLPQVMPRASHGLPSFRHAHQGNEAASDRNRRSATAQLVRRHAPFALRTIVELVSTDGLTGISETYGGEVRWRRSKRRGSSVIGSDPFQLTGCFRRSPAAPPEAAGRPHPDLSGAGRESSRSGLPHIRRAGNRLPRSDRQGGRQAGLRRDRRPRSR